MRLSEKAHPAAESVAAVTTGRLTTIVSVGIDEADLVVIGSTNL